MDLFLIRHAEAVDLNHQGVESDADRFLTELGQEQSKRLGSWFAASGLKLSAIVTSPLVRAHQTVEGIVSRLPDPTPTVHVFDEIAGAMRPKRVSRFLEKFGAGPVVLVGHQPTLGEYLGWLIGDRKIRIDFGKGALARLAVSNWCKGGAKLVWFVNQDWLIAEVP
jgi:phosphohistidine phosphatase